MRNDDQHLLSDIRAALETDPLFKFTKNGSTLVNGICPNCGQPECFVSLDKPFKVMCNRRTNCGYSESTRKIYAHLFSSFSDRFHPSDEDPNAPATAYLVYNRGFTPSVISGLYTYGHHRCHYKNEAGKSLYKDCPAVVFTLENGSKQFRFIDQRDADQFSKTRFLGKVQGSAWCPPGIDVKKGDVIYITEGIFKTIALLEVGLKSVTGLSCSSLPLVFIERHLNKGVKWVIAFDNDAGGERNAGIDGALKCFKILKAMKEEVFLSIPQPNEDWDDVFRAGRLTSIYLTHSLLRGHEARVNSGKEKAFFHFLRTGRATDIIIHNALTYRYTFKFEDAEDHGILQNIDLLSGISVKTGFDLFLRQCEMAQICEGVIDYVYSVENLNHKRDEYPINYFNVSWRKNNHVMNKLIYGDGSIYLSTKSFNENLSKQTGGDVIFFGKNEDLVALHALWRAKNVPIVTKINFFGFVEKYNSYVFPQFIYNKGVKIKMNQHDFATIGKNAVTCNISGEFMNIEPEPMPFNPSWITPYKKHFDKNGMILLSWWIGTLFAEQIRMHSEHWPFIECIGAPGSGKSTAIKFLWKTLGAIDSPQGFDPNRTSVAGLARQIAQFSNLPVVLMESDRAAKDSKQKGFDFTDFKPCFEKNAVLRAVGIAGGKNETEILTFKGGLLIMQNADIISDKAGYERLVTCRYETTVFSRESVREVDVLNEMSGKELGGFLHHVLKNGETLFSDYKKQYEGICQLFASFEDREKSCSSLRLRRTHAQIAAFARLLPFIFDGLVSEAESEDVVMELWARAKRQFQRCQGDSPTLERFWDSFEYLTSLKTEEGVHRIPVQLNHSSDPRVIAISLPEVHKVAADLRVALPPSDVLIAEFKTAIERKCLGMKCIRSVLTQRSIKCWLFQIK